jgi:hypothetical protein
VLAASAKTIASTIDLIQFSFPPLRAVHSHSGSLLERPSKRDGLTSSKLYYPVEGFYTAGAIRTRFQVDGARHNRNKIPQGEVRRCEPCGAMKSLGIGWSLNRLAVSRWASV